MRPPGICGRASLALATGLVLAAGTASIGTANPDPRTTSARATGGNRLVTHAALTKAPHTSEAFAVTLASPRRRVTVTGQVALRAAASAGRGIAKVVFAIDGKRIRTDKSAPYTGRWNSTLSTNGRHSVSATAFARSGRSATRTLTVTVANQVPTSSAPGAAPTPDSAPALPAPTVDAQPPAAPGSLAVSAVTATGFKISWSASTDDVGVTGYLVRRNGVLVATVATPAHTFAGLSCATNHTIEVQAIDAAGNVSAGSTTIASTSVCPPAPPPTPSTPATLFLSPGGSDAGACTHVVPCRSMDRAYQLADTSSAPVVVELGAGTYPGQTINPDASKATDNDVVFRPAAGASVIVSGEVRAVQVSHLTIAGIALEDWYLRNSDDVTIQGVDTIAGYVNSSTRVRVLGGDYGPTNGATHSALLAIRGGSLGRTRDVLVDGVYFHDHTRAPGEHAEAMQIWSADDVTISNSKFKTCAVYCIFVANFDDPIPSRNVLIENNWFAPGSDSSGSQGAISYWAYGLTIRNNSFVGSGEGPNNPVDYPSQNVTVTGNLGTHGGCNSRPWLVYSFNVWEGSTPCSPTDRQVASAGLVDPTGFDLHLRPDSAAINSGNPLSFPTTDIDGDQRPMGGAPDAGADERP